MDVGYKITVEEWAGDLGFIPSDKQIKELIDALSMVDESYYTSGAFTGGQTEEEKEIKRLNRVIEGLENFIASKNISIVLHDHYIKEFSSERISSSHVASNSTRHYF